MTFECVSYRSDYLIRKNAYQQPERKDQTGCRRTPIPHIYLHLSQDKHDKQELIIIQGRGGGDVEVNDLETM